MSRLSIADKTFLEGVFAMSGGYVLDFTDGSFANLLADINIREGITDEHVAKIRTIASGLGGGSSAQTRGPTGHNHDRGDRHQQQDFH